MTKILFTPASVIWVLLMSLTVLSWTLGEGLEVDPNVQSAASMLIMAAAIIKVRMVVLHFMDVKIAPTFLRIGMELWFVVIFLLIAMFYFFGADIAAITEPSVH